MKTKSATRKGVEPLGVATPKGLTPKQIRFVDEYLVDLNAAGAARRAGYSAKTADRIGYDNLRKVEVAAAIEAKRKQLAGNLGITRERILQEMAKLAFSDLRGLFGPEGKLLHPTEWPEGAAGAVAGMDIVEEWGEKKDGNGKEVIGYTKKLKLWDKGKQLENLLKHLGMGEDKPAAPEDVTANSIDILAAKLAKFTPQAAA